MTASASDYATTNQFSDICRNAESAFKVYGSCDPSTKAALLEDCAERIDALGDQLTETANSETNLPAARLEGERKRTVNQLKLFASVVREGSWVDARIDNAMPDRQPMPKPDIRRMLRPLGPVAVFGASNFPLAFSTAGGDTASALAAGCPVIYKAHPAHPKTTDLVARAISEALAAANLPQGVFQVVHTSSNQENLELVKSPSISAVGFTGSIAAGRALMDAAASRPNPIPVFAEMGSSNPIFLAPNAVKSRPSDIAAGLKGSVTLGVGQFCTKPGVVLMLKDDSTEDFIEALSSEFENSDAGKMLHDGIAQNFDRELQKLSGKSGVETLVKNQADPNQTEGAPALLKTDAASVLKDHTLLEECFGPAAIIVTCESEEQLVNVLESLPGQLTGSIHCDESDQDLVARLVPQFERRVGRIVFNGFPTGVEVCSSMQHGGPYPASSDPRFTSVGTAAIFRFARPVSFQNSPAEILPDELKDANPLGIARTVDNVLNAN